MAPPSWKFVLNRDFSYQLTIDSKLESTIISPCEKNGVVIKGTLTLSR